MYILFWQGLIGLLLHQLILKEGQYGQIVLTHLITCNLQVLLVHNLYWLRVKIHYFQFFQILSILY